MDLHQGKLNGTRSCSTSRTRQLVLDGERIELTPLEFGVVACLIDRKGQTVTRRALVEKVWGYDHATAGSNGVDVVGRSLRKKLGDRAPMIETVRGRGYRMRDI